MPKPPKARPAPLPPMEAKSEPALKRRDAKRIKTSGQAGTVIAGKTRAGNTNFGSSSY